ncbi:hypothetical protein HC891_04785 [Candidatus Gracilibacteria bacterium]|nr:hypothetical protein [Candidatus Gracilibacteria bacterium]
MLAATLGGILVSTLASLLLISPLGTSGALLGAASAQWALWIVYWRLATQESGVRSQESEDQSRPDASRHGIYNAACHTPALKRHAIGDEAAASLTDQKVLLGTSFTNKWRNVPTKQPQWMAGSEATGNLALRCYVV